jgi:hypothetical protein
MTLSKNNLGPKVGGQKARDIRRSLHTKVVEQLTISLAPRDLEGDRVAGDR